MNNEIFNILDRDFFGKLKNTDIKNDSRYLIAISAIPQAGISTLAKLIEDRYKGVRVEKNAGRIVIYDNMEITDTKQVEDILDEYIEQRIAKILDIPNKLIIWDGSIDRNYAKYQEWARKYGYKTFVIQLNTDRNIIEKRIDENKDESTAKWYHLAMDKWEDDNKKYTANQQVDFIINNNSKEDTENLLKKLNTLIT